MCARTEARRLQSARRMRVKTLLALLAALAASKGAGAAPSNKSCLVCHTQQFFDADAFSKSVHAKLDCADCHRGYDFSMHRAKPPEWSQKDKELIDRIGTRSTAPAAFAACAKCHESQRDDLLGSVHNNPKGPLCNDCHGSPHAISKIASANLRKAGFAGRCLACHEKEKGEEYRDSVHGRLVMLGSDRAPSCFNCHGSHEIQAVSSPDSAVNEKNKVATCAECHKGATANFAATFTHVAPSRVTRPIPGFTVIFFSWLTSLVLTGLVLHVGLDFGAETRQRRRRKKQGLPPVAPEVRTVKRFDIHQLIQHWVMITACIILVATGWPLRGAHIGASRPLLGVFGGVAGGALWHRIGAVLMTISALYHLIYLTVLAVKKQDFLSMLPGPKDLRDLWGNVRYFFGMTEERPKFSRFMYAEKFDYWAVFWGIFIMFGSGLVRWFPVWFAKWMPASIIEACQIAHGDEATLAALALFVWHLYNVHLRPSVFPMSWVWIDGKMDVHTLKEEHGAEYEDLQRKGKLPGTASSHGRCSQPRAAWRPPRSFPARRSPRPCAPPHACRSAKIWSASPATRTSPSRRARRSPTTARRTRPLAIATSATRARITKAARSTRRSASPATLRIRRRWRSTPRWSGRASKERHAVMAALAVGALAPPRMRAVARHTVAVRRLAVQPCLGDVLVAGLAADALGLRRGVRLVAGGAGEAHRRVVGKARRVDALVAVAAQAVAPAGPQRGLDGEEVVAREAVELLHAGRVDDVVAVAGLAALAGRLEAVHAGAVALDAGDLLLDGVDAVAARGADVDPVLVVGQVAGGAGAERDGRVRAGLLAAKEGAEHREPFVGAGVMALLAGDAAVLAAGPEREFGAGLVAGGAEARIFADVRAHPHEPEDAEGYDDGRKNCEGCAHPGRNFVQPPCRWASA